MAALHSAVLHGIGYLQAGNDFTGGKHLNLELAASHITDDLGGGFSRAKDRVERLGKLDAQRHLIVGVWANAGAVPAARMPAIPEFFKNLRRSIEYSSVMPD